MATPARDPNAPAAVKCVCPVCRSSSSFENECLVGGEPSAEYLALKQSADRAAVLEGELAAANAELAELRETAAGHDDPPPAPRPKSRPGLGDFGL